MEITCPKCAYTRVVPEGKIPATAELATCPKCKARFKFRDAKGQAAASAPPQPESPRQRPAASPYLDDMPRGQKTPAQQPPPAAKPVQTDTAAHASPQDQGVDANAVSEDRAPEAPQNAASSPAAPPEPPAESSGQDDFWDKLETMGSPQDARERHADWGRSSARSEVPWEELEIYGFFRGMFLTIKQVMLSPIDFFKSMPIRGGISRPLVFYLLISEIVAVFAFIFQMMGMAALTTMAPSEGVSEGLGVFSAMGVGGSALVLVLYPVLFTIGLFINTAITHFFLMIFKAADSGFEATFRVSAYGNAPIILAVIPLVGPIVGTFWTLFVLIIGFKYAHRASYGQVIMAFVTPLLLLFSLAVVAAVTIPFLAQG